MKDIVIPQGNEYAFIEMAEKLGYSEIIFLYKYGAKLPHISELSNSVTIKKGILGDSKHLRKENDYILAVRAEENNRTFFEHKKIDIIFGLESVGSRDFIHHRNSSLNQILCRLAKENMITVGISFSDLFTNHPYIILGRMIQNIRFLKKYGASYEIFSFAENPFHMRSSYDLSLFLKNLTSF
jgi:RNase P/RNase MRP subunit p30